MGYNWAIYHMQSTMDGIFPSFLIFEIFDEYHLMYIYMNNGQFSQPRIDENVSLKGIPSGNNK
jgi:hypothetical protein